MCKVMKLAKCGLFSFVGLKLHGHFANVVGGKKSFCLQLHRPKDNSPTNITEISQMFEIIMSHQTVHHRTAAALLLTQLYAKNFF